MMKAKGMSFVAVAAILTIILLTGYQPATGAPPAGEVKTVAPLFGNGPNIPYLEVGPALDWMDLFYDSLVGSTPEGGLSPELGVAHKWEMSPDGLTWTFYLRKGVKFHDGSELTAKDVKFSIEQLRLPDAAISEAVFVRKNIKSIEVKDPYTVVIQCNKPDIFLNQLFSNVESPAGMIVPKDYYERVGKDEFSKRPIGSGPYKFHSQLVGSFIKLEATDKHWRDGVPRYKYMTYLVIPEESTRLAMLRTGEADVARVSRESVKEAQNAGLNVMTKDSVTVVYFQPNMQWTSPVFSDIRFRKALNFAIDSETIIKQLLRGLARPIATWPGSTIVAVGGDPKLKPYPYDPQEAKRLIKEGGWEGHEFTLLSYNRAGFPEFPQIVETVAGYWEKIGLKPKIRMTEWAVWREAWAQRKTQNTVHGNDADLSPDVPSLLTKFTERWDFKNPRSAVNIPEVNERFRKIEKSIDVGEISKLMGEIYRYAYDNYLIIPICEFPQQIGTTKKIPKWDLGRRRQDRNYYDLIRQR